MKKFLNENVQFSCDFKCSNKIKKLNYNSSTDRQTCPSLIEEY